MTNPKDPKDAGFATAEQVAELARRLTAIEQTLAQKMPAFEQVAGRVSELSTAFQTANGRLSELESAIRALEEAPVPGGAEQVAALAASVAALAERLARVEQTRARGGRLSNRLASIEAKLDTIAGGGEPA